MYSLAIQGSGLRLSRRHGPDKIGGPVPTPGAPLGPPLPLEALAFALGPAALCHSHLQGVVRAAETSVSLT